MGGDEFVIITDFISDEYPLYIFAHKLFYALNSPSIIDDTEIDIKVSGKTICTVSIFDLDDMFGEAQRKATKQSTDWHQEFPAIFNKRTDQTINGGQALMLWQGHRVHMEALKKSLLPESEPSNEPESPSRTRKKRTKK